MKDVVSYYRDLHRMPELSGAEVETAMYLEQELLRIGYLPQRIGKTGVYADLVSEPQLPWLLLRADTDALAIQENSCADVISENSGVMHACGHDAHCAMLLEAAKVLYGKTLPQNIRFLFQPAEETTKGAAEMIENGVIPQNLCACFAMHLWPGVEKGKVVTCSGKMMASSDVFFIRISGRKAHCAQQHLGADALQTALTIATGLNDIRKQATNPQTILFCGSIHSGSSHNVVPDEATLMGTLRSFSPWDRQVLKTGVEYLCRHAAQAYDTKVSLVWDGGCPAIHNDAELIRVLQKLNPTICDDLSPTMAAEDFACYQDFAPGVMMWMGVGDVPPLHNEAFYVPTEVLPQGVELWMKIARHKWKRVEL